MQMKKMLFLLPESIIGRLIIKNLCEGFKENGVEVETLDMFERYYYQKIDALKIEDFSFLVSYDYSAIKFKKDLEFEIPTINYFSDKIQSETSGRYWQHYYDDLKLPENIVFYGDDALTESAKNEIDNIFYLPLFVNTNIYKNLNLETEYDIMFAGNLCFEGRLQALLGLIYKFPDLKFGIFSYQRHFEEAINKLNEADQNILRDAHKGFIPNEIDMAIEINKSRVLLNFTSQGKESLNYRIFETLACEKFLLTDHKKEIDTLFSPNADIVCYNGLDDLNCKIEDYLNNSNSYDSIIKNGKQAVDERFSHIVAAKKILDMLVSIKL